MLDPLARHLGREHVLTGADAAPYGEDWTGSYKTQPRAVLRPANTADVSLIMHAAQQARQAIVPVSGKTGLTGGTAAEGAVMISLERMNKVACIKRGARVARVEAGVVLADLHDAAADAGMVFPMTFGAKGSARIGGMLSTNAGGSNVLRYGNMRDLCLGIEAVLPDGSVLDAMTELHKNNSGYDLRHLLIGAEGTLGIITGAVLKLFPEPKARATAFVGLETLPTALDLLNALQDACDGAVEAFEYMPAQYHEAYDRRFPDAPRPLAQPWPVTLLVEVASASEEAAAPDQTGTPRLLGRVEGLLAKFLEKGAIQDATLAQSEAQRLAFWARREAAAELTYNGTPVLVADIAVPLDSQAVFLSEMEDRLAAHREVTGTLPVAHLGDGNLHYVVQFARPDPALEAHLLEVIEDTVARCGGSFSAEHGIGLAKRDTMRRRKDPAALAAMRAIKGALDPGNICNPGKLLP